MLLISALLFLIFGVIVIFAEINNIIKTEEFKISNFMFIMFGFLNGFIHALTYFCLFTGYYSSPRITMHENFGVDTLIVLFLCIVSYAVLKFFYNIASRNRVSIRQKSKAEQINSPIRVSNSIGISDNAVVISTVFLVIVAWVSLFLWTQEFGGIIEFSKHAALIRSGVYEEENSKAFFKHFAKFFLIIAPLAVAYVAYRIKNKQKVGIIMIVFTILALVGLYYFGLCSDSRGSLGLALFVAIMACVDIFRKKEKGSMKKTLVFVAVIMLLLFIFISLASELMNKVRFEDYETNEEATQGGLIYMLLEEFSFVVGSQHKMLQTLVNGDYKWMLPNDILATIGAWVPGRFLPFKVPENMWGYNSYLVLGTRDGATIPSGMIVSSMYLFHVAGPIILPAIIAVICAKIEKVVDKEKNEPYRLVLKYSFAMLFLWFVGYYQLSAIIYERFYLFIGILFIAIINKLRLRKN